jgi:hypothetical protein
MTDEIPRVLQYNLCIKCSEEVDPAAWSLEREGLYLGKCQRCGCWMYLWEYRDGRCVADPGEEPIAPAPELAVETEPATAADKPPAAPPVKGPRRRRNEVNPMQVALFGTGKEGK